MKKRILFIISSADSIGPNHRATGYYLPEVTHPYYEFVENGYQIDFASVLGGQPPADGLDVADEYNTKFLASEAWERINTSQKIDDVDLNNYDAVFVPGGLGPMVDMPNNTAIQQAIADTYDRGAIVGAVCHGPVALLNVKLQDGSYLVAGKKLTAFSNSEEEGYAKADVPFLLESALVDRGAEFSSVADWQAYSIADGRLITGQNPASAKGVAQKMMAVIEETFTHPVA
ncbi:MAG: type 1 glutamine amidotransferase domain-containing protein [Flammeovirgaceae bacterium]